MDFLSITGKWRRRWWACLPVLAALCQSEIAGQTGSEYEVKALCFVALARYTEWPTNAFMSERTPLIIGVLSSTPITEHLEPIVKAEKIQGRVLQIRRCRSIDETDGCHLVFFGKMNGLQQDLAIARLREKPILTVGDSRNFMEQGGMIEMFVNEENKVRLRINKTAIQRAGLQVSQALLKNAEKVAVIGTEPAPLSSWISRRAKTESEPAIIGARPPRSLTSLAARSKSPLRR